MSHFLSLLWKFVFRILFDRMYLGTVSKALLISTATSTVLSGGACWLKPSRIVCVTFVRRVLVECCSLKPCCSGDMGKCGLILVRIMDTD